jgi:hypothetical protein
LLNIWGLPKLYCNPGAQGLWARVAQLSPTLNQRLSAFICG